MNGAGMFPIVSLHNAHVGGEDHFPDMKYQHELNIGCWDGMSGHELPLWFNSCLIALLCTHADHYHQKNLTNVNGYQDNYH